MKKILFLVLLTCTVISSVEASQNKRIELNDGSVIEGQIVSFSAGKYTVKSPSLGTVQVEDSKIRAIHMPGASSEMASKEIPLFDTATAQNEMQKLQPAVTGNPEIMKMISGLIANPDFQALLQDPEIVNAAKTLNIQALLANEKFVKAMNNPIITQISQKVKNNGKQASQNTKK